MRMLKAFGAKGLAIALALSAAPMAVPAGAPVIGPLAVSKAEAQVYIGGPRYYRGDRWGGWDGRRSYDRRDRGDAAAAAIIGGIVGLGLGAAIASQPRYYEPAPRYYEPAPRYYERAPRYYERRVYRPAPVYRAAPRYSSYALRPFTPAWYDYCSARYRSFDPRSGTFQPYHGPRQLCR